MACLSLVVALLVDRCWGEPHARFHPVVWIGNYLAWAGQRVQSRTRQQLLATPDYRAFWLASAAWCFGAAVVLACAALAQWSVLVAVSGVCRFVAPHGAFGAASSDALATVWGVALYAALLGLLLKPLLSWAMLNHEVLATEVALDPAQGGSLETGRARLGWLVSRDVTHLTETEVRESAIETLAENLNDSVFAPLFWFALFGLPGAALYRFANTADAMWGYRGIYRGVCWEWAGKWAAHADDVLSWLPARITALFLLLVSGGKHARALADQAAMTPSPNSGWPMAAMALALDVTLRKPGVYVLHASGLAATPGTTQRAIRYANHAVLAYVGALLGAQCVVVIAGRAVL